MRESRNIRCDLHASGIEKVSLYTKYHYLTCRYTRSMVCTNTAGYFWAKEKCRYQRSVAKPEVYCTYIVKPYVD